MNPTLIDLHVRPNPGDESIDLSAVSRRARETGIDGIAAVGLDAPPDVTGAAEGVTVFAAIEVDTDVGRLVCFPKDIDEWFTAGGWKEVGKTNGAGPAVYVGDQLVAAFTARGGAVIAAQPYDRDLAHPCGEDAFTRAKGLSAVVVTSSPRHTASNERAVTAAMSAELPCVAGSASGVGGSRFGTVATLFARPPSDQAALVEGLRKGRVWPAEIGPEQAKKQSGKDKDNANASAKDNQKSNNRGKKKRRGGDDNRGNRLDLNSLRAKPTASTWDQRQPDLDPIARLYGLADRKVDRFEKWSGLNDDELDRINGNRERGADTNVMCKPDFRVLRAERQHVSMLLQTIEHNDEADSVALRFAVHALENASPEQLAEVEERHKQMSHRSKGKQRRRRRRRG